MKWIYQIQKDLSNPKYQGIIKEYNHEYVINGWNICILLIKFMLSFGIVMVLLFSEQYNFQNILYLVSRLLLLTIFLVVDKRIRKYPLLIDNIFIAVLVVFGMILTDENIQLEGPVLYAYWLPYQVMYIMISIIHCLSIKKILITYIWVKVYYLVLMSWVYGILPVRIYFSILMMFLVVPMWVVIMTKQILDFMKILYKNKELIATIKHILQIFPEGVIIRIIQPASPA